MRLTQDRLKEELTYDPSTGIFMWLKARPGRFLNRPAGSSSEGDYVRIRFDGKLQLAHKLAWLYMTGEWPTNDIDHVDLDRQNNRFSNLREATRSENMRNTKPRSDNKSGFKGVSWCKSKKKWQTHVTHLGQQKWLGWFDSKEAAAAKYVEFAAAAHGEFFKDNNVLTAGEL